MRGSRRLTLGCGTAGDAALEEEDEDDDEDDDELELLLLLCQTSIGPGAPSAFLSLGVAESGCLAHAALIRFVSRISLCTLCTSRVHLDLEEPETFEPPAPDQDHAPRPAADLDPNLLPLSD